MCGKIISISELMQLFPTEKEAREWFEEQRWGENPVCPTCRSEKITVLKREGYYECRDCKGKFTVRIGTAMHRSHIPLRYWIFAMYLLVTARKGISSMQLSRELGIRQASAWFLLHRIREACKSDDSFLKGVVEIDETYIGRKEKNKHADKKLHTGHGGVGKQPVFGMREREGEAKAFIIHDTSKSTLQSAVCAGVIPGSTIYTDDIKS